MELMTERSATLLWLDAGLAPRTLVGGKGAALSWLASAGAAVPPCFAVTTEAYLETARYLGLPRSAHEVDDRDLPVVRSALTAAELSPGTRRQIQDGLALLAEDGVHPVAVRSSAPAEDSASHSFAG